MTQQDAMPSSTQPLMPNLDGLLDQHATSAKPPSDFKNKPEYTRRWREALGREFTDAYVYAIQTEKQFDPTAELAKLGFDATPTQIHERAATMENRVLDTSNTKINEERHLTNGSMNQIATLETGVDALRKAAAQGGITEASFKAECGNLTSHNLRATDLANVAGMQNISIPASVLETLKQHGDTMCTADSGNKSSNAPGTSTGQGLTTQR